MKELILENLENPKELEILYRKDKNQFVEEFRELYPKYKDHKVFQVWHERLDYEQTSISWGNRAQILFVITIAVLAGIYAKFPDIFSIDEEFFYPRNFSFIVIPFLAAFFAWTNKLGSKRVGLIFLITFIALLYINLLPNAPNSDSIILACIHLPLVLWGLFGLSYVGRNFKNLQKRLEFLRFNGDLVVMSALLFIAGAITSAITIGLFDIININIEEVYFRYIVVFGMPVIPILGTYLAYLNPQLVGKISPLIAKIFTPLVLIILTVYTATIIITGSELYQDRDFLMLFNVVLIAVIALVFFSIAESHDKRMSMSNKFILLLLSLVTIVVNAIALSAILFRISEWGVTPNRLAVLGGNVLIFINLSIVTGSIFMSIRKSTAISEVGRKIASYLPIYIVWAAVVAFMFPLIFNFV
ncbi:MAG: hypothetical protein R3213_02185 [Flavobacteriaceae bacterium]|nr:hypothetical protein [Flavobacteriaceae bacterium]